MDPHADPSGDFVLESETNLLADSSTLGGLGPRSLAPSLDLLIVLVPVANDAAHVASFINRIESQLEPPFGVLLVYNRDDDSTLAVATEFARTRPWLDLVPSTIGPGPANALRTGFRAVGHGPVVVMSVDGSDDVGDLARMRRLYSEGHSVIAGSRDMRGGHRRGGSVSGHRVGRWVNRIVRRMAGWPLTDATHSFRLYDASLVNEMGIDSDRIEDVPMELAAKACSRGLSIIEIPTAQTLKTRPSSAASCLLSLIRWRKWCRVARQFSAGGSAVNPDAEFAPSSGDRRSSSDD